MAVTGSPVEPAALGRAVVALAGVLMLLAAGLWLLQRHGQRSLRRPKPGTRIAVTSAIALDARVRLVLVRRDAVEHLLAIGPTGVQLLESLSARDAPPTVTTT